MIELASHILNLPIDIKFAEPVHGVLNLYNYDVPWLILGGTNSWERIAKIQGMTFFLCA